MTIQDQGIDTTQSNANAADRVERDIEFELAVGAISADSIGASIQLIRRYQNKVRAEAFDVTRAEYDVKDLLKKQFQLNDMLLALSQEMAAALISTQRQFEESADFFRRRGMGAADDQQMGLPAGMPPRAFRHTPSGSPKDLQVALDVRPSRVPVLGPLMGRMKLALHQLVLFYVNRLADQQNVINQRFAESIDGAPVAEPEELS